MGTRSGTGITIPSGGFATPTNLTAELHLKRKIKCCLVTHHRLCPSLAAITQVVDLYLCGTTGSGKSYLARVLVEEAGNPKGSEHLGE
jgi:polynucleotide 5'-kinase involved in rRNA processing